MREQAYPSYLRVFHKSSNVAGVLRHRACTRNPTLAGDRPPRYDKKTPPFTVGRGPVPRHAFGCQTASHRRSGSPDPDPFGSGRSRTTEVGPMPSGRRDRAAEIETRRSLLPGSHRDMKHPQLGDAAMLFDLVDNRDVHGDGELTGLHRCCRDTRVLRNSR